MKVSEFPESYDSMKGLMLVTVGDNYMLKDKILQLNREVVSRNGEIAKLKTQIAQMRKAGDYDEDDVYSMLMDVLGDKYPGERITMQRKEINNLHRVIRELKESLRAEQDSHDQD